ncbi:hypothetical protein B0J13DRAFT_102902 [Dactylonectria estremocensis]|uniref:Thioredoxin domain-containing protein n=1 Tax=Dactylonectria estremocensis TaxID=1079267 RepID=A0A9P9E6B2_9HYPO|nr:hypothetical protein B0J13DRAFT_102902 [Dactylonectria estremocensis]
MSEGNGTNSTTNNASNTGGFFQGFETWKSPMPKDVAPALKVGFFAPSTAQLPLPDGRLTIVVFLRHAGCPFAEKTFRTLAALSDKHKDIHCIAVSHSSMAATDAWLPQIGGSWLVDIIIDDERDLYAQWGLGITTTWHVANPATLWSAMRLAKDENIWNRNATSGSRWQLSGAFAVDRGGIIRWVHVGRTADDLADLNAAVESLSAEPTPL